MSRDLSDVTPDHYRRDLGWIYDHLTREKPRDLARLSRGMVRGLDVGAGCGQYARILNRRGFEVTSLDPNPSLLFEADPPKLIGAGEALPFHDGTFDFSYAINVLHHINDPVAVLEEMRRVSQRIIVSEVNGNNPINRAFIRLRLHFDEVEHHYSPRFFRWMLEHTLGEVRLFYRSLLGVPEVYMWGITQGKF